jgi:hypothetical protein
VQGQEHLAHPSYIHTYIVISACVSSIDVMVGLPSIACFSNCLDWAQFTVNLSILVVQFLVFPCPWPVYLGCDRSLMLLLTQGMWVLLRFSLRLCRGSPVDDCCLLGNGQEFGMKNMIVQNSTPGICQTRVPHLILGIKAASKNEVLVVPGQRRRF